MAGFNLMTQQGLFWLWSAQKHAPPVLCQQCPHAPLGRQLRTAGPSTSAGENPQRPKSKSLERLTISPTVRIRNDQLRHKCLRFGQSHADGKAKPSGIGVESRDRTTSAITASKHQWFIDWRRSGARKPSQTVCWPTGRVQRHNHDHSRHGQALVAQGHAICLTLVFFAWRIKMPIALSLTLFCLRLFRMR